MSEAIRKQYCVGGVWKDSKTKKWMPVTDSSTGEVIAEVPSCTQDEVLEAIDAADKAFKEWSQVSISKRTQMMFKWRNILVEHLDELTYLCAKELGKNIPICLHLDHGNSFELCKSCIDMGFSSVMIDGSSLPYDENVALTKKVVEYAHQHDVTVEGELGVLAGVEDEVASEVSHYTKPEEVVDFVTKTGVDSLAISIGTSHGAYKFTPEQCTVDPKTGRLVPPPLAFDVLAAIEKELPGFPIVLHGSSSVPQEEVETINKYGGALKAAVGIPEEELRQAAKSAVCKINIDSDLRLAMTGTIRQFFNEHPDKFDPREYLKPARANIKELVRHKLVDVLGCAGKA